MASTQLQSERLVTIWGLVVNLGLTAGKIVAGLVARSSAIIADGLHSASDLGSDIAVLWGIHAAKRPADEDHHFGHSRYEAIVTLLVGGLLVAGALFIGIESVRTISERHGGIRNWWPLGMAIASIVLKEGLYWWTRAVGRRFHNPAVIANAWHHRSDAFSSIAAAVGIAGALIGGPRWAFLDHLTAVILAAFLVVIAIGIIRDALQRLSDRAPHDQTLAELKAIISQIPGVRSFHALRARHSGAGNLIEMDVHIEVDPAISVREGHHIATEVEERLRRNNPDVANVVVHIEPPAAEKE